MFRDSECVLSKVDEHNKKEVVATTNTMRNGVVYPIFQVSCVDKRGLKLFIDFLSILPSNKDWLKNSQLEHSEFLIFQMHTLLNQDNSFILVGIVSKGLIFPR